MNVVGKIIMNTKNPSVQVCFIFISLIKCTFDSQFHVNDPIANLSVDDDDDYDDATM